MEQLASAEPVPVAYGCTCSSDEDVPSEDIQGSTFQKKLHPEKCALTLEEKELLIEHDFLAKLTSVSDKKLPLIMGWLPYDYDNDSSTGVNTDEEDDTTQADKTRKYPPAQSSGASKAEPSNETPTTTTETDKPTMSKLKREFSV